MIKILFMIHDLGQGGAEKVLVNLVNNMNISEFQISIISLFGGGVNEKFLHPNIRYKYVFPKMFRGNVHIMKLFSPKALHRLIVKDKYDIEISYLEGPSARIISGCNTGAKMVSWIHVEQHTMIKLAKSFRSEKEAISCYNKFDKIICVSQFVKNDFCAITGYKRNIDVLYNTVISERIRKEAEENANIPKYKDRYNLIAVGTLKKSKGYQRLLRIVKKIIEEQYQVHLYILGEGPLRKEMEQYINKHNLDKYISLLGYQINPYKYMSKSNLFICSSFAEGFSTAVTEALILGIPVCTVDVSGMKELLGNNNEFGVVTENNEKALYHGIKRLLDDPDLMKYYADAARYRGKMFETKKTVQNVESMLLDVYQGK